MQQSNAVSSEIATASKESTTGSHPRSESPFASGSARGSRRPGRRRARDSQSSTIRYFVGRPADPDAKPSLEQELASEPEALVIAFKSDKRVYFITEYNVTQKIEGGQVRLEKQPAAAGATAPKGVSTTNES